MSITKTREPVRPDVDDELAQRRHSHRQRTRVSRTAVWVGLGVFSLIALSPFFYLASASLRDSRALFRYPPDWIPTPLYFGNYETLLFDRPFLRWTLNTLFVAGSVTVLKVAFDTMAAYAFAKLEFFGRRPLFWTMLASVMVPVAVLIIPLYLMVRDMGGLNTYWALILPHLANPVGIFMMRAFIQQLPNDLENAARIDNCSYAQVFWRIILPLVKPGMVVVALYTFFLQYTNLVWPLVVTNEEEMFVLTTGLASLQSIFFLQDWGLVSAASLLTMVPITLMFLFFQRYFLAASLAGALKE